MWTFCVGLVAAIAAFVGLLTKPLPASLRPVQVPVVNAFEGVVDRLQFSGDLPWMQWASGAFKPVPPVHGVPLSVKRGAVPDLDGVYMRVGPSLAQFPPTKRNHVFDGDGMVYSVRLQNGSATYHCSYLETPRYLYEKEIGQEWFMRLGELYGWLGLAKLFTTLGLKSEMAGVHRLDASTANTAVGITPEGKLWALNEAGRPFRFNVHDDGSIASVGIDTLSDTLQSPISAHPKYDYATGETFYHGRQLMTYFKAGRIRGGVVVEEADLPVMDGFNHDMFITQDYVVVVDGSSQFSPKNVAKRQPLWVFEPERKLRFGVAKRSAPLTAGNFVWIEAPVAAEIVHTCFGWNDGAVIQLFAPAAFHNPADNDTEKILGGFSSASMKVFTIDVAARSVTMDPVVDGYDRVGASTEFCRVRDDAVGGRTRYAYSGVSGEKSEFNFTGIAKWDMLERKRLGYIQLPYGSVGGEPVFIPRGKDDAGYLSMFLWYPATQTSTFVLYDAEGFGPEPAAELAVPVRVPLGFHGWWLPETDLARQI